MSDPKKVTAQQHVQEYSSEPFTVSAGKLFCYGCREELSLKCSSINNHVKCSKHKDRKVKLATKDKSEIDIAKALQKHNEETHLVGETLPEAQQVYRVKVVHAFLKAGVPLNKLDCFKDILEHTVMHIDLATKEICLIWSHFSSSRNTHNYKRKSRVRMCL